MPESRPAVHGELAPVALRAAAGEHGAWTELVGRFDALLRGVARGYRLPPADVDDVVQTTWLRALEHVRDLQDPGAIAGWLIVTTRRESMRVHQRAVRELVVADPGDGQATDLHSPEATAIARERVRALRDAVTRLTDRQRRLITTMLSREEPCYERLSADLRMPLGSIGPTRGRALARLREDPRLEQVVTS
jgi:RNA polymerase sigma factor (sigma-70 family)